MNALIKRWYQPRLTVLTALLLPLSWIFALISGMRKWLYQCGVFTVHRFDMPVIVVGNITVGGTGKTPLVIWLVASLQAQGYRPGVVSRGVGARQHAAPYLVTPDGFPQSCGDEPLLIARKAGCPVVIDRNRVRAVKKLIAEQDCNVIISDDGLQHYALGRDIEIAVVDGERGYGNQARLPAGPLREPTERLASVDFVVWNGVAPAGGDVMRLQPHALHDAHGEMLALTDLNGCTVHAVAGIGNPARFFTSLNELGAKVIPHAYPDHHQFTGGEINFGDGMPVVVTEKDAVKLQGSTSANYWVLSVVPNVNQEFINKLMQKIKEYEHAQKIINGLPPCTGNM